MAVVSCNLIRIGECLLYKDNQFQDRDMKVGIMITRHESFHDLYYYDSRIQDPLECLRNPTS